MKPRELLGIAEVPGGPLLRLVSHDGAFIIEIERNELMSSRMSGSEVALGRMTLDRLGDIKEPHILIGGYGMGFTLRAVLAALGHDGRATVVELVPDIIEWARGPMAAMTAGCLDDPRVELIIGDVGRAIGNAKCGYDAILLDVDNGPDGLTRKGNDVLYKRAGLIGAREALRPGGILAVWSAAPDEAFGRRLEKAGFEVEERRVAARENGKGPKHTIWFATSP